MKRPLEQLAGTLVWFRTDLRLRDNPALHEATQFARRRGAAVSAVYVFSTQELSQMGVGPVRVDFIRRSLAVLHKDLADINIPLHVLVLSESDSKAYANRLVELAHELGAGSVFFNNECDPTAIARDLAVKKTFTDEGIMFQDFYDQCIVREGFVLSKMGKPYAMFTPFKNCWLQHLQDNPLVLLECPEKTRISRSGGSSVPDAIPGFDLCQQSDFGLEEHLKVFPAGEQTALDTLSSFFEERGRSYKESRNFPAVNGTSKISPYLAIGAISARTAFELARKANGGHLVSGSEGLRTFMSELCWRDFYRHILHHFPHVGEGQSFKPEAARIEWRSDAQAFDRWCHGMTGIPIVDAAMRQLKALGWMHNRLRMIVSMFLTKDLLLSWKQGETWFAKHLIDYDFPSNNGGWQWSASTGTDSQPYFRIFNPFTQSENYDREGEFIKRFVPELRNVPAKAIHNPAASLSKEERAKLCPAYPDPMVDHALARNRALDVFKKAFKKL